MTWKPRRRRFGISNFLQNIWSSYPSTSASSAPPRDIRSRPAPAGRSRAPCVLCGPPIHEPPGERHGRAQVSSIRHAYRPRRLPARPDDRRARRADLPDDVLRLPRHRRGRLAVQPVAFGPHLFAHLEPDDGGARGATRGARRRRRLGVHGVGPGGAVARGDDADGGGRPYRLVALALRRQPQPVRPHAAALRHHHHAGRPARRGRLRCGDPARDAARVR